MVLRFASVALVVMALVPHVLHAQSVPGNTIDDPEAYAVYAAVLATRWPFPQTPRSQDATIALDVKTASRPLCESWTQGRSAEWSPVLDSYSRANAIDRWLLPNADIGVKYDLVDSAEYEKLLMEASGDATNIYKPFWGNTNFSVSSIGFNPEKTRAVVALQHSGSVGAAGAGKLFALEKRAGRWAPIADDVPSCEWR